MKIEIIKSSISAIAWLRGRFLAENQFQIRYDACHARGWADEYLIRIDQLDVGYVSVKGLDELADRDTVFEVFLIPEYRNKSSFIFREALALINVPYIECQTNDTLTTSVMFEFAYEIRSKVILFDDDFQTGHGLDGLVFRRYQPGDDVFGKEPGKEGQYVLIKDDHIIADGGFLTHYNFPFADLYMEVAVNHREQGYGSFILQEIKKECYQAGRVPAARCNISNPASKGALLKAGMKVCGYMLSGKMA